VYLCRRMAGKQNADLSVYRAFVVHLGTGGGPRRRRFHGRVEHLSSGQAAHFHSLDDLLRFFTATLAAPGSTQPTQRRGSCRLPT